MDEDAMPVALLVLCGVKDNAESVTRHVFARSLMSLERYLRVARCFSRVERARLISADCFCSGLMSKGSWKSDKGHKNSCW